MTTAIQRKESVHVVNLQLQVTTFDVALLGRAATTQIAAETGLTIRKKARS